MSMKVQKDVEEVKALAFDVFGTVVVASQFHPEFKSRPTRTAPLFREFVGAALERVRAREGVTQLRAAG